MLIHNWTDFVTFQPYRVCVVCIVQISFLFGRNTTGKQRITCPWHNIPAFVYDKHLVCIITVVLISFFYQLNFNSLSDRIHIRKKNVFLICMVDDGIQFNVKFYNVQCRYTHIYCLLFTVSVTPLDWLDWMSAPAHNSQTSTIFYIPWEMYD